MSRNNSTHLACNSAPIVDSPVRLPLGRLRLDTIPVPTGSPVKNTMGISPVACFAASALGVNRATITSTLMPTNSAARLGSRSRLSVGRSYLEPDVLLFHEAGLAQPCAQSCPQQLGFCIVQKEHSDAPHTIGRLCARSAQPRRSTDKRDELAPPHSITSSASCWRCTGTSKPSALAVVRLITRSYFVGVWTGSSFGLVPLRIRSA